MTTTNALTWTKKKPTVPGAYWTAMRWADGRPLRSLLIHDVWQTYEKRKCRYTGRESNDLSKPKDLLVDIRSSISQNWSLVDDVPTYYVWAGPIPEPQAIEPDAKHEPLKDGDMLYENQYHTMLETPINSLWHSWRIRRLYTWECDCPVADYIRRNLEKLRKAAPHLDW